MRKIVNKQHENLTFIKDGCKSFYIPKLDKLIEKKTLIDILTKDCNKGLGNGEIINIDFIPNKNSDYKSAFIHYNVAPKYGYRTYLKKSGIKFYYSPDMYFKILPNTSKTFLKNDKIKQRKEKDEKNNELINNWSKHFKDSDINLPTTTLTSMKNSFDLSKLTERVEDLECLIADIQLENSRILQQISSINNPNEDLSDNFNSTIDLSFIDEDEINEYYNFENETIADVENQVHNLPTTPTNYYPIDKKNIPESCYVWNNLNWQNQ